MTNLPPLALGVMTGLGDDPLIALSKVRDLGFPSAQLGCPPDRYLFGPDAKRLTDRFREAVDTTGVQITAVFIMFHGHVWDLVKGPNTIGLVPSDRRGARVVRAVRIANWAARAGIGALTSHIGFIPEDPDDPSYPPFLETMRALVDYFVDEHGQTFAFETGQETPATLVRTIADLDRAPHVGINLDPANLLLYGKARPMDVVDLLAPHVFNTHCKDGHLPEPGGALGHEVPLGDGDVRIRELIPALYQRGYRGPLTIEREISGPKQIADIERAKALLESIRDQLL